MKSPPRKRPTQTRTKTTKPPRAATKLPVPKPVQQLTAVPISIWSSLGAIAVQADWVDGATAVATLAAKFEASEPSHAELIELRDVANALAAALRKENKVALAQQLSDANRVIRRRERTRRSGLAHER